MVKNGFIKYTLFPLALFLAAFLTDKLFYVGDVEDYFLRTASFINYDHKEKLIGELDQYLQQPKRKKVMLIFGNSRTMTFEREYIDKKYPQWILFNFSVPGGNADYYYYFMEKLERRKLRPDVVYFIVSPQGYNATPSISMDEVMLNGLSFSFIVTNINHYSLNELSNYAAKKLFWNYQFRPKLSVILMKLKNNQKHLKGFRKLRRETHRVLEKNLGSIPIPNAVQLKDDPDMEIKSAHGTWRNFLYPFNLAENQFYFTERFLSIAAKMDLNVKLLWARVGPELRRLKDKKRAKRLKTGKWLTVREAWEPEIKRLAGKYRFTFLDMNYGPTLECDRYYDASHLASMCFADFFDFLIKNSGR